MAVDVAEKKRKRASDRHERPSKKPALEPQDLPPLKASVVEDESELAPVIVTTPGLKPPRKLPLHPYIKSRRDISSSSTRGRNPGIVSSEILLQSSEHPKLDFVGREADDDADAQLKHYIAVVDPVKKTWQFVEARKVTLRGVVRRLKVREDKEEEEEEEPQTIRAQRNALTDAFGTKQSRKAAQSVAENATLSNAPAGETNAVEAALLSSMPVDSLSVADKEKAVQAEIQAAKPLPQANLSASHPSDVYPLDVLVAGGVSTLRQLPNIKEWQDAVAAGGEVRVASRYVVNRVHAVAESGNITHLQILRYILLLLEFARCLRGGGKVGGAPLAPGSKRLPPRDDLRRILSSTIGGKASEKIPPSAMLPDPVIDSIRRKHAPQGSHLTKTDLTLLQTTICALSLHIPPVPTKDGGSSSQGGNSPNELATDPSDLRDDLRLDNQVIQQYFRELGCRIDKPRESEFAKWGVKGGKVEAAARRICRLRVPVEFPKVSRGARK